MSTIPKVRHQLKGKVTPPNLNDPDKVRRIIAKLSDDNPRKAELQARLRHLEAENA